MCRSIVDLRRADPPAGRAEAEAAARQFVRKVSGFRTPSAANHEVFEAAVRAVADATDALLDGLVVGGRPIRGSGGPAGPG
jgi:hypothetical protein